MMCGTLTRTSVVQQMRRYLLLPPLHRDAGDVHSAHSLRTPTFDLVEREKKKKTGSESLLGVDSGGGLKKENSPHGFNPREDMVK